MPRSPLIRLLSLAHTADREARATGVPADEIFAERERARLNRRELLKASGVVAASTLVGSALAACVTPGTRPIARAGSVGIVGAGLAGLHCAHRLRLLGVDSVVLYEAQRRVGGRVFTDHNTFAAQHGQHCELGGELIDTEDTTMLALAGELGLPLLDYQKDDASLDAMVAHFGGRLVGVDEVLKAYAPIAAQIDADLAAIGNLDQLATQASPAATILDGQSLAQWFEALVKDGRIAEDNIARRLFEVAYTIEYGREPREMSALNLHLLTSTSTEKLALFGDSDERFHTAGGNDSFVERLAVGLPERIFIEKKLVAMAHTPDGRVRLSFERGPDAVHDHVVVTLPFTVLRQVDLTKLVLSPPRRRVIAELGYGKNTKLMLGFDERPWRRARSNGETYSDLGYQATWETSRLQPGDAGILTNFTGGDVVPPVDGAAAAKAFLERFDRVFDGHSEGGGPRMSATFNGRVARFDWGAHEHARGSYACYLVGQNTTIAGTEGEPEGNVHFAGEHTSTTKQGYMEGAAESGARAAREVAAALGVATPALAPRRVLEAAMTPPSRKPADPSKNRGNRPAAFSPAP